MDATVSIISRSNEKVGLTVGVDTREKREKGYRWRKNPIYIPFHLGITELIECNKLILYRNHLFVYLPIHPRYEEIVSRIHILRKSLLHIYSNDTEDI